MVENPSRGARCTAHRLGRRFYEKRPNQSHRARFKDPAAPEPKTYTFVGYDRPDVGNKAWLNLGMLGEIAGARKDSPPWSYLGRVREYLEWLERELRECQG